MNSIDYLLSELDWLDGIERYDRLDSLMRGFIKKKPAKPIKEFRWDAEAMSYSLGAEKEAKTFGAYKLLPDYTAEFEEEKPEPAEFAMPEKKGSVEILTDILSSLPDYNDVTIQRVTYQYNTRIPVSVVYFTYACNGKTKLGRLFVKNYEGNEHLRRKDTVLPMFYNELGVPTPNVLGFDPEKGYEHKFALFVPPSVQQPEEVHQVLTNQIGNDDFAALSKVLNPDALVKFSKPVVSMAVKLQLLGSLNNNLLRDKYGFELERTHDGKLIHERLLQYLRADQDSLSRFTQAYKKFCSVLPEVPRLHCQGDCTENNVRIGEYLEDCYLIDFELSRDGAALTEDVVMFGVSCVGKRGDRNSIQDMVQQELRRLHFEAFEEALNSTPGAEAYACTYPQFERSSAGELIKAHLFKIGDQVWIQGRDGSSEMRKQKAVWHLDSFLRAADAYCSMQPGSAQVLHELKSASAGLFRNSSSTLYLKPTATGI